MGAAVEKKYFVQCFFPFFPAKILNFQEISSIYNAKNCTRSKVCFGVKKGAMNPQTKKLSN